MSVMWVRTLLISLSIVASGAGSLSAAPLYDTPVYDPASKSYFALVDGRARMTRYHPGYVWHEAIEEAPTRIFKAVRGRVAIITNIDTYEFLMKTFRLDTDAWIGYRYRCKAQLLSDSIGRNVPKGGFSAWDKEWKQDVFACAINRFTHDYEPDAYAPVAIHPVAEGFRWFAKGPDKGYLAYFIEYPTGGP